MARHELMSSSFVAIHYFFQDTSLTYLFWFFSYLFYFLWLVFLYMNEYSVQFNLCYWVLGNCHDLHYTLKEFSLEVQGGLNFIQIHRDISPPHILRLMILVCHIHRSKLELLQSSSVTLS